MVFIIPDENTKINFNQLIMYERIAENAKKFAILALYDSKTQKVNFISISQYNI